MTLLPHRELSDEAVRLLRVVESARQRLEELGVDPGFVDTEDLEPVEEAFRFEDEPGWLGPGEQWADDHRGEQYRRPKGTVVYEVLDGAGPYGGVMVRRSSDDREVPMAVSDLMKMVKL